MTLTERIKLDARRVGFDAVGIARVSPPPAGTAEPQALARLRDWLARGYEGAMAWMRRGPERRADPTRVLAGCRSIIVLGMNYYTEARADERPGNGRIARYAWGDDYHEILGRKLAALTRAVHDQAPDAASRWYVDTGPIMEKWWAERAGLGWIGKHSNLVSPRFGSWLLLGVILTTLELDADEPGTDLCGSCTLCIRACPTGAIVEPAVVDARRCISYLTIELPRTGQAIPMELEAQAGNRIFGCDDCLDVCPYNAQATATEEPAFHGSALTLSPRLDELATMPQHRFEAWFAKSPIRRPRYAGFLRSVLRARRHTERSADAT